jgi:hypothetical protein
MSITDVQKSTVDQLEQSLTGMQSQLARIARQLQMGIPIYVDEYLYLSSSTTLQLLPQSQNLEYITGLIAQCLDPGGGTLTLGKRTFTLPIGRTVWTDVGFILNNGDIRQLTQAANNVLSLELFGYELPDKGPF